MASVKERFDVVIVGAGPAGLVTAAILAFSSAKRVLVLEKGDEIDAREALGERAWVEGVGGAGLYSDGKLCMSLEVGGHLREELPPEEKSRLLGVLNVLFRWALSESVNSDAAVFPRTDRVDRHGVTVTSYPVLHIGTDRGAKVIRNIVELVRDRGVAIRSGSELLGVRRERQNGWELTVACGGSTAEVHADSLIFAMGKVGAQRQAELCEQHGATLVSVPMYVGVRFECDSGTLRPLFNESLDPKIKLRFPDGTRMKTHCATLQGEIAPLHYEGLPLAGGHGYTNRKTGRGGFAVLWDGIRSPDNFGCARDLMGAISRHTEGQLLVQRLVDFLSGKESSIDLVRAAGPSLEQWNVGNIREFYPQSFSEKLEEFLRVIGARVPGLRESNGLLFAPAIEWWMRRVVAEPNSMRSGAGIYVCGDGSGWSQGIVHAAATGIIAAEDLLRRKISAHELGEYLSFCQHNGRNRELGQPVAAPR